MIIDPYKIVPIVVVAAGVIAAGAVGQHQLASHASDLSDLSDSVDENEDEIAATKRRLEQLSNELRVQQIETQHSIEKLQEGQTRGINLIIQKLEAVQ